MTIYIRNANTMELKDKWQDVLHAWIEQQPKNGKWLFMRFKKYTPNWYAFEKFHETAISIELKNEIIEFMQS